MQESNVKGMQNLNSSTSVSYMHKFGLNLLIELKAENSFEEKCWFQKRTWGMNNQTHQNAQRNLNWQLL